MESAPNPLAAWHADPGKAAWKLLAAVEAAKDVCKQADALIAEVPAEWDGGDLGYLVGGLASAIRDFQALLPKEGQ